MKYALLIFFILLVGVLARSQTKEQIIQEIKTEAQGRGIDPDLAVAIATVESGLNPKAIGRLNERGLFQLRPEFHTLRGDYKDNIRVGVNYLSEIKAKHELKHGGAWFVGFNYGPYNVPVNPTRTKYYKKVNYEISRIKIKRYLAQK